MFGSGLKRFTKDVALAVWGLVVISLLRLYGTWHLLHAFDFLAWICEFGQGSDLPHLQAFPLKMPSKRILCNYGCHEIQPGYVVLWLGHF